MKHVLVVALALLGAAPSPAPQIDAEDLFPIVQCFNPLGGGFSGSGTYINDKWVLTASHVTHGRGCTVNGRIAPVIYESTSLDIAVLATSESGAGYLVPDCHKPKRDRTYQAIGYPHGEGPARRFFVGTGDYVTDEPPYNGLSVFDGEATAGMSGSALLNDRGEIVGVLLAGNDFVTFVRDVKDLWLCKS